MSSWRSFAALGVVAISLVLSGCPEVKESSPETPRSSGDRQGESSKDSPTSSEHKGKKREREKPRDLERQGGMETESGVGRGAPQRDVEPR